MSGPLFFGQTCLHPVRPQAAVPGCWRPERDRDRYSGRIGIRDPQRPVKNEGESRSQDRARRAVAGGAFGVAAGRRPDWLWSALTQREFGRIGFSLSITSL